MHQVLRLTMADHIQHHAQHKLGIQARHRSCANNRDEAVARLGGAGSISCFSDKSLAVAHNMEQAR